MTRQLCTASAPWCPTAIWWRTPNQSRPENSRGSWKASRFLSQFTYYGPSPLRWLASIFVHPFTAGKLDVLIYVWYYMIWNMMSQMDLGCFLVFRHLYCTYISYLHTHTCIDSLKGWDMTYDISKFGVWQDGEHRSLSASATEARCGMKWSFGGMLLAVRHMCWIDVISTYILYHIYM